MASTVLPNGIIIPEKFSRDWYADLYHNWQELDNLLGGGTPKDGTLTIQKNGTTVGTFSANQATDETINIEVPDVNNGTLTIQKNGTTVDTFTANSSTDKTVDITVPTKTSDLTNDSGFITEDTTKIPLAGSNAISGSLIPATNGAVNLGSPSYQWNNAYIKSLTINGVACGDILTHNVSEFVDVSSNQTIGGTKTFGSLVSKSDTLERGSSPTTTIREDPIFISVDKKNRRTLAVYNYYFTNGNGRVSLYAYNQNTTDYDSIGVTFDFNNASNNKSVYPSTTETYNLGTSINKWKSLNGINPGALSLPSTYVNVDTTNWVLDGSNVNIFTPASDGWLGIQAIDTVYDQMHYVFVGRNDSVSYYSQNVLSPINALWDGKYHGCIFIPVIKNINYDIRCICSSIIATFYPCQGNV